MNRYAKRASHVPVGPLREQVERLHRQGMPWYVMAELCGYFYGTSQRGDQTRFRRRVGLESSNRRKGEPPAEYIAYDRAVAICRALDIDPVDAGV